MHEDQNRYVVFLGVLVMIVVVSLIILSTPVSAAPYRVQIQSTPSVQLTTPTTVITPTEISEQTIQEGKPVGIIIGATALVAIILLSTLIFLPKRERRPE